MSRPDITLTRLHALKRALEEIGCTDVEVGEWGIRGTGPPPPPFGRIYISPAEDAIALREALELEAEEREARDWRAGVERPEV